MPVIATFVAFAGIALTALLTGTFGNLSAFHNTATKLSDFDTTSLAAATSVTAESNKMLGELKSSIQGTLNSARYVCKEGWETQEYYVNVAKTRTVRTPISAPSVNRPSVNSSTGHVNYNPYAGYNQPSRSSSSSSAAAKARFRSKFRSPQQYRRFKKKIIQKRRRNKASLINKLFFAPVSASTIRYQYKTETYYVKEKRTRQVCKGWGWVFPEGEKFRRANAVSGYLNSLTNKTALNRAIKFGLNHGESRRHKGEPGVELIHSNFLPAKTSSAVKNLASTLVTLKDKFTKVNPYEQRSRFFDSEGSVVLTNTLLNTLIAGHPNGYLIADHAKELGIRIHPSGVDVAKLANGLILDIQTNIQKLNEKNEIIPNSESKVQKVAVAQLRFEGNGPEITPTISDPPTKTCTKKSTGQSFTLTVNDGACYDTNGFGIGCVCYDAPLPLPPSPPATTPSPRSETRQQGTGPVDLSIDKLPSDSYTLSSNNGGAVISKTGGDFRGLNVENGELVIRIGDKFSPCTQENIEGGIALGTVKDDETNLVNAEDEISTGISMVDTVNASNTYGKLRKDLEIRDQNLLKSLIFSFTRLSLDSNGAESLTIPAGTAVELTTNNRAKLIKRDFSDLSDFNFSFYDSSTGEFIVTLEGSNVSHRKLVNGLIDTSISRPSSRVLTNCGTGRIHSEVRVSDLFDTGSNGDATLAYANMRTSKKRSSQAATLLNNTNNFRQEVFSGLEDNFGGSLINIDLVKVAEGFFRKNGESALEQYLEDTDGGNSFSDYYEKQFKFEFTNQGITLTREQKDEWELSFFQGVLRNIGLSNLSKDFLEVLESYLAPVQAIVANSDPTLECLLEEQEKVVTKVANARNKRDKAIEKRLEDIAEIEAEVLILNQDLFEERNDLYNVLKKIDINNPGFTAEDARAGKKRKNPVRVDDWNKHVQNAAGEDIRKELFDTLKELGKIYSAVNEYKSSSSRITSHPACRN